MYYTHMYMIYTASHMHVMYMYNVYMYNVYMYVQWSLFY